MTIRAALLWLATTSCATVMPRVAHGEPYLAVQTGFKCVTCHINPSGGGMRNAYGTAWARSELARAIVTPGSADSADAGWTGEINRYLAAGGNVRTGIDYDDTPGSEARSELAIASANVYAAFRAIPELLTLYLDEQVAPGGATAREAYALLTPAGGRYTVKAGKLVLPHGLRLQDDTAFVRQVPGINFDTADHGLELGIELPRWSAQLAVSNGTAGGGENDSGKQASLHGVYVTPSFRIGASYNHNDADLGDRKIIGAYAGLRTGPIAWLAEANRVEDDLPAGERRMYVSLFEGNWRIRRGHNLKVTYEYFDPDDDADEDQRERYSVVWELSPMQHLQSRLGVRFYNGVPGNAASNRDELFAELHIHF
jgi:hypothetical protein